MARARCVNSKPKGLDAREDGKKCVAKAESGDGSIWRSQEQLNFLSISSDQVRESVTLVAAKC